MKYIEELYAGQCFDHKDNYWITTIDFKSNGKRLCYNLKSGVPSWFDSDTIVDDIQIYTMDEKNIIIPIKETEKNATTKTINT